MAIRTRKDERARVVDVLEEEHESADKLADAVLKITYELMQAREWYVFGATVDTLTLPYGFYSSSADAVRAAESLGGPIAGVVKVYPAAKLRETLLALAKPIELPCPDCSHSWEIHGQPAGCHAKNCPCERRHAP